MSSVDSRRGAGIRALAARLNVQVTGARTGIEQLLSDHGPGHDRDRPLLRALVSGSLRWHHRLTWQVEQLATRRLKAADAELGALLRIGLFQLQWLRVPDHAAVSATVEAAGGLGLGHARGFVNAVLRRFIRERPALEERMAGVEEARFSHPQWLIDALKNDWPNSWARILEANNELPPMWLRVNRSKTDVPSYLKRLRALGLSAEPSARAPEALMLATPVSAETLPGFAAGLVSVQDLAAQLAAGLLDLEPGLRVLDACAAPGGKTAHMLEVCPELAEVVALDRDEERLGHATADLTRLGLRATPVHADATRTDEWWDGRLFDRILLDAPCSALGVIRRHPDIKVLRRPPDIETAAALQAKLLRRLWPTLKPGGRMVYSTCTVLRNENQSQIEGFLAATDAELRPPSEASCLQLMPGEANADGFYYACLGKRTPK